MKARDLILIILSVIIADQAVKFFIKLNFYAGEEVFVMGSWFRLHFIENEGMAWGWKFGGSIGKIILTLFRLVAVIWGIFILRDFIRKQYHKGFIICSGLIFAGALGNLIDSMFYGLIFENSDPFMQNVAHFMPKGGGYTSFLHGRVVDMLYFPMISTILPTWVPFVGGTHFDFFEPVFNIADAAISVGVFIILLFQKSFFKHLGNEDAVATNQDNNTTTETAIEQTA